VFLKLPIRNPLKWLENILIKMGRCNRQSCNVSDVYLLLTNVILVFYPQIAFQKFEKGVNPTKTSSYNLRPLLWEAGSTVSNKVLECLVLRFAKSRILTSECFIMAMVRLHLAHGKTTDFVKNISFILFKFILFNCWYFLLHKLPERYHSLDTKMSKGNPLSLEEVNYFDQQI